MNSRIQTILNFWFEETPPEKRFQKDEKFDLIIRKNFLSDFEKASIMNLMIGKQVQKAL